jgi:hypothetical protein
MLTGKLKEWQMETQSKINVANPKNLVSLKPIVLTDVAKFHPPRMHSANNNISYGSCK